MSSDHSEPEVPNGLTISPSTGMVTLPVGGSPALSEIISRSLAHIQTSRALVVTERRAGEECEYEIAPGVSIVMCWIPPGEFLMGSPDDEEDRSYLQVDRFDHEHEHRVTISKGFWLAKTPTTQAQWEVVMKSNRNRFKGKDLPVGCVSWLDICGGEKRTGKFLRALNRMDPVGVRFDLPTEAQWEYAARAGTVGPYYGILDDVAWYHGNSRGMRHVVEVGQKKPNTWGLHDMLGNIWEWCSDWYGEYPDGAAIDPTGPASGSDRVVRGGSWFYPARHCRAACRSRDLPSDWYPYLGFRVARSSVP